MGLPIPRDATKIKFPVIYKTVEKSTGRQLKSFTNKSTILKLPGRSNYLEPGYIYEGKHKL